MTFLSKIILEIYLYCKITQKKLKRVIAHRSLHAMAQVNALHINPNQAGCYLIYIPQTVDRLS